MISFNVGEKRLSKRTRCILAILILAILLTIAFLIKHLDSTPITHFSKPKLDVDLDTWYTKSKFSFKKQQEI
ncbi:hypothetical protein M0813_09411 [Anaeramoeba flamelloides]|uniref:Uncharacterized protein n=1 Tax=Anaeramoeba flamelloides TaxID=1746091 RepID=A0AAV7Y7F2_9EUKA|nr:hypothetical protein M0812_29198 [Anaeramoeba flamelloides]KAJ6227996.1 hypothetical protein M0813_09411 [Anaeramoeba flamelloides]